MRADSLILMTLFGARVMNWNTNSAPLKQNILSQLGFPHYRNESSNQQAENHILSIASSEKRLIRKDFIIYIWGRARTHPPPSCASGTASRKCDYPPTSGVTNGLGWYRPRNFARNLGRRGRYFCMGGGATVQAPLARTTVASINPLRAMTQLLLCSRKNHALRRPRSLAFPLREP